MTRARRLVQVAVYAPMGAAATVAAALRRRRAEVAEPSAPPAGAAAPIPAADETVDLPAAETPVEALPIDGYAHLAASQVVDRLGALTPTELDLVDGYERAHRHRQSVLAKIAQLRS